MRAYGHILQIMQRSLSEYMPSLHWEVMSIRSGNKKTLKRGGNGNPKPSLSHRNMSEEVVVNLKKGTVRAFSLALPARNSNVDINAYGGADMVFVPRMELLATDETDRDEIAWETVITAEAARRSLELKFLPIRED